MESPQIFGHTAYYRYIEAALHARWATFLTLEAEMHSFEPRPASDFSERRDRELMRLQDLNPSKDPDELAGNVDKQFVFLSSPSWQVYSLFDQRHMADYVSIVILAHTLCEALINAVLAIGLARSNQSELFALIERTELKQKWLLGPKAFAPTYSFPRGTGLHEALNRLVRERNALVHLKIDLEMDGERVLGGSGFERRSYDEEQRWLRRFFSLPYDLVDFLDTTKAGSLMLSISRGQIPRSPANGAT